MNEQQEISRMEELGLSNKEARVYVACLELGASPVQRIADKSGIKRVTTYVVLESLVGLGLVSQSVKGKKTYFVPEDPSNLERLLQKKEKDLQGQRQSFAELLPALKGLSSLPSDSPSVRFYDSADGIRTIMKTFLDQAGRPGAGDVFGFSNIDLVFEYFPDFRARMSNPERTRAGIRSHFLYTSKGGPILKDSDKLANRESRWVPSDKFPIMGDFTIVGNNVMILSLGSSNPIGLTISSREIAQGLRVMFEVAWEAAAAYNE